MIVVVNISQKNFKYGFWIVEALLLVITFSTLNDYGLLSMYAMTIWTIPLYGLYELLRMVKINK